MSQPIQMEYYIVSNLGTLAEEQLEQIIALEQKVEKLLEDFQRIKTLTETGWVRASTGNDYNKVEVLGAILGMIEVIAEENIKD